MIIKKLKLILALLILTPLNAYAQNTNDVKNLGDILNPRANSENDGKPLTAARMANNYYKKCIAAETLVFTQDEIQTLCACSSANMAETLTIDEFTVLEQDSRKGRDARGKAISFGYAPCMQYVIETKIKRDCQDAPYINDVIIGKKAICQCTTDYFQKHVTGNGPYIILEALKYNPMTLNPLEDYFRKDTYIGQRDQYIRACRDKIQYQLDRK